MDGISTKKETNSSQQSTSNLQFDPQSKNIYNQLTGSGSNVLQQYMSQPFNNPWYNLGAAQGQRGANQMGQNMTNALTQNMRVSGIGGGAGNAFQMAQMGKIGRATGSMRSQANLQNIFGALGRQMQATGMGMSFQPLMTGENSSGSSKSVEQTSGLGTWLPQLLGAGLQGAMGAMTGGASMAGGAGGLFKASQSLPLGSMDQMGNLGNVSNSIWGNAGAFAPPNPFTGGGIGTGAY